MIKRASKRYVRNAIKRQINALLNPTVEIVTPFEIPTLASPLSAGYDIQANLFGLQEKFFNDVELQYGVATGEDGEPTTVIDGVIIHPGGQFLCPTGIHTAFEGFIEAQIRPRSGLALKQRITITNSPGTIEGDYKNEWGIILANESDKDVIIHHGDKVAQVVFSLVVRPNFVLKDTVADLGGSDRGGGFGHSGK